MQAIHVFSDKYPCSQTSGTRVLRQIYPCSETSLHVFPDKLTRVLRQAAGGIPECFQTLAAPGTNRTKELKESSAELFLFD